MLLACSVVLTSCSDDDISEAEALAIEEATNTEGKSIIGIWAMTETQDEEGASITKTEEFNFKADKTGTYKTTETGREDENISFTWVKSEDVFTLSANGDTSDGMTIGDSDGTMALLDSDGEIIALKL